MPSIIKKWFYPEHLVKKELIEEPLPGASSVYRRCLKMAWPAAVESVFIALMGLIDTIMVGRLGSGAISAVGITTQPKFLFMALIFALNVGVTAVIARLKGEKDNLACRRTLVIGVGLSLSISAVMTVIALSFPRQILIFAGAQESFVDDAESYFRIIMIGQFFNCIGTTINAAQRGIGKTKIAMYTNTIANIVNVIFNYLLINGIGSFPRLEVKGAAIATMIGSIVSCLISVIVVLNKKNEISLICKNIFRFDKRITAGIIKIGSSGLVEQVFMRIGFFTFATLVAHLGKVPFATHQICMNIISVSFAFADGFSVAATGLVGQSLGERRKDFAMMYARACQRCIFLISIVLTVIFFLTPKQLMVLFTDEKEVIELGIPIIYIIAVTCFVQTSQVVLAGALRGAGDSRFTAMTALIGTTLIRPVVSWVLCHPLGLGLIGAWIGLFADQFIRLIMNFIRFSGGKWTNIKV